MVSELQSFPAGSQMYKTKVKVRAVLFVSTKDTEISAFDLVPDESFEQSEMVMGLWTRPVLLLLPPSWSQYQVCFLHSA